MFKLKKNNEEYICKETQINGNETAFICNSTKESFENTDLKATFYEDCNYQGASSTLGEGRYDINQIGIRNDTLSSIKIPRGLKVTIYSDNFEGAKLELFSDEPCLINKSFNDIASSFVVETNPVYLLFDASNPFGDKSIPENDTIISEWKNLTGKANLNATGKPKFVKNSSNELPGIQINAPVESFFSAEIAPGTFNSGMTVFVVYKNLAMSSKNNVNTIITRNNVGSNFPEPMDLQDMGRYWANNANYGGYGSTSGKKSIYQTTTTLFTYILGPNDLKTFMNGEIDSEANGFNTADTGKFLWVGTRGDKYIGFNGIIYMIAVYIGALDDKSCRIIEKTMGEKWGIPSLAPKKFDKLNCNNDNIQVASNCYPTWLTNRSKIDSQTAIPQFTLPQSSDELARIKVRLAEINPKVKSFLEGINGFQLWYDASDPTADGNFVSPNTSISSWKDKSNNKRNLQATGNPSLVLNSLNGLPGIQLNAPTSFYSVPIEKGTYDNNGITIFVVYKSLESVEFNTLVSRNIANSNLPLPMDMYNKSRLWNNWDTTLGHTGNFDLYQRNPSIFTWRLGWDKQHDGRLRTFMNNEADFDSGEIPYTLYDTGDTLWIGTRGDKKTGFNGILYEIIVFRHPLNDTARTNVYNYLRNKWFMQWL